MSGKLKVGVIGAGGLGYHHVRLFRDLPGVEFVGFHDARAERAEQVAKELKVRHFDSLDALLAAADAVTIVVPTPAHHAVTMRALAAGKHVLIEKPIAATLEDGLEIEALEAKYGVTVTVGHSARLMAGVRKIREAIDAGELGRVAFMEANFSNERALELTPQTWRWYKARAPGGPLSQLAIHQFDVLHYLGGEIAEASSMASKLSPVGAEVDDQSMTLLKFADGKIGYVGSCWTSPGVFAVRVFGSKGLMHYEIDFGTWDTPDKLHENSTLYIQRGRNGYAKREELKVPESDMFRIELEMFADSCRTRKPNELTAHNGNVAVAVVNAALRSIERRGQSVTIADVIDEARRQEKARHVA